MTRSEAIDNLARRLSGLENDAVYWDLRRTYGDYSREVLAHLRACEDAQAAKAITSDTAQRSGPWARRSRD